MLLLYPLANPGEAKNQRAGFVVNLKAVNKTIIFNPSFKDIESGILDSYDIMVKAANDIPR